MTHLRPHRPSHLPRPSIRGRWRRGWCPRGQGFRGGSGGSHPHLLCVLAPVLVRRAQGWGWDIRDHDHSHSHVVMPWYCHVHECEFDYRRCCGCSSYDHHRWWWRQQWWGWVEKKEEEEYCSSNLPRGTVRDWRRRSSQRRCRCCAPPAGLK